MSFSFHTEVMSDGDDQRQVYVYREDKCSTLCTGIFSFELDVLSAAQKVEWARRRLYTKNVTSR